MLPYIPATLILLWGGFFAYWWITALGNRSPVKRTVGRFGFLTTMALPAGLIIVAAGIFIPSLYTITVLPDSLPVAILGLVIVIAGIAFAILARVHLGRNWSSQPAIRENHTITRTGPYSIVRHPIYTGILTGILGTAIATGAMIAFVSLFVILVLFLIKIRIEEQFLLEEFGSGYEQYKRDVKAIVPFVL